MGDSVEQTAFEEIGERRYRAVLDEDLGQCNPQVALRRQDTQRGSSADLKRRLLTYQDAQLRGGRPRPREA